MLAVLSSSALRRTAGFRRLGCLHTRTYTSPSPTSSSNPSNAVEIRKLITDSIKATGPMSIATYMQMCLSFPDSGYYMKDSNAVFGSKGDFITSPEISQVFGELMGVWLVSQWMNNARPPSVRIVELGPGRGTLMADMLRAIGQLTPPGTVKSVHLVENSPFMRSLQSQTLSHPDRTLEWHQSVDEIKPDPEQYTMVVAHEFFDALPINIIKKKEGGWHEIMVDLDSETPSEDKLRAALSREPSPTANVLAGARLAELPTESQIEISRPAFAIARQVAELTSAGGCGLIVDYGADEPASDSFRAFREHTQVDVFHRPGECDLTADVDFSWLRSAMAGLVHPTESMTQARFLVGMGLQLRVKKLLQSAKDQARREQILESADRLVDVGPGGMGGQYKFMGFRSHTEREAYPFE